MANVELTDGGYRMSSFFSDPLNVLKVGTLVIAAFFATAVYWYTVRRKREIRHREAAFVTSLVNSFNNNALMSVEDVLALHHAEYPSGWSQVQVQRHVHYLLRAVQLRISSSHPNSPEHALLGRLDDLRTLIAAAVLLDAEERRVPFYGTPEPERAVLEDIFELTRADKEIVGAKLTKLAELVTAREDTLRKIGEEKGHARKLALLGFFGTFAFGIISLILTLTKS
jgi:hypothetical protein